MSHPGCGACARAREQRLDWPTRTGTIVLSASDQILLNPEEYSHLSSTWIEIEARRGEQRLTLEHWRDATRGTCWHWPRVVDASVRSDGSVVIRLRSRYLGAESRVRLDSSATAIEMTRDWTGLASEVPDDLRADDE